MTVMLSARSHVAVRANATDLLLYVVMTIVWGSTYFFTAIALRSFAPMTLVCARMTIAAVVLFTMVRLRRIPLPGRRISLQLFVFGLCNVALPFTLLAIAQTHLPSALTSVLVATTPAFTFLIAGFVLRSETVT
ncbi:EamA family transporter, partial [Bacillus subtilis]